MKRLLLAALLFLTPIAAKAYIVLTQSWVYAGAVADFDFVNGRYYSNGFVGNIVKYFTVSRTSSTNTTATNLLPTSPSGYTPTIYANGVLRVVPGIGLLSELVRTNFLLNSTAPATQTTGSLANGTYTLWVNGSGTATMSTGTATGCGTGVASQGTPISFTLSGTAGTCTVTVAGSLNQFQLELNATANSVPTSFIQTAGATAFRATDAIQFPTGGFIQTLAGSGTGTVMCQITRPHPNIAASCFGANSGTNDRFITSGSAGGAFITASHTNVILTATDGGPSDSTTDKVAVAWDGTGRCIVWNGGTAVCDSNTYAPAAGVFPFSINNGVNPCVPGKRLTFWAIRLPAAALQKITK